MREALPGDNRADVAMDYNNVGTGLYNLSRFREADAAYSRGIAILESRFGKDHPRLAYVLYGRAATLVQLGRFREAIALLDRSDAILSAGNGSMEATSGGISSGRLRANIEFLASDYPSASRRLGAAMPQLQASSPVSVAAALALWGRIEIAEGKPLAASDTLANVEKLYVDSGRGAHMQRWIAHGLHGVALARLGDLQNGDKQLEEAFQEIASKGVEASVEFAEISLRSGAAARRRGEFQLAIQRHQIAEAFQKRSDWLGELGRNLVMAELVLDGQLPNASVEAQQFAEHNRESVLAALQSLSPKNPLLAELLASRVASRQ